MLSDPMARFAIDRAGDAIYWIDTQGNILYANQAALRTLGYTSEEILQLTVHDIDPGVPPGGWGPRSKRLKKEESFTRCTRHQRKDGSTLPVEVTANYMTLEGEEYICVSARDITERRKAESALRLLKFSADHSSDAAYWVGKDGTLLYVNDAACTMFGYERDELLRAGVSAVSPMLTEDYWSKHWERNRAAQSLAVETYHRRKDGTLFPVEVTIHYLRFEEGQEGRNKQYRSGVQRQIQTALLVVLVDTFPKYVERISPSVQSSFDLLVD